MPLPCGEIDDGRAERGQQRIGHDDDPGAQLAADAAQHRVHLVFAPYRAIHALESERGSIRLDGPHDGGLRPGKAQDRDALEIGSDFLERLEPLSADRRLEIGKARHVAARPRQRGDEALPFGIGDADEHGRNGLRGAAHGGAGSATRRPRMTSGADATMSMTSASSKAGGAQR